MSGVAGSGCQLLSATLPLADGEVTGATGADSNVSDFCTIALIASTAGERCSSDFEKFPILTVMHGTEAKPHGRGRRQNLARHGTAERRITAVAVKARQFVIEGCA